MTFLCEKEEWRYKTLIIRSVLFYFFSVYAFNILQQIIFSRQS